MEVGAALILCSVLCITGALSQSAQMKPMLSGTAVVSKDLAFLSLASASRSATDASDASNKTAPEEGSPSGVPDLDYEKFATLAMQYFLPKRVTTAVIAGLAVLKGVNDSIQAAFTSMPEAALFAYCVLLGIFSFMICQMYWEDSTRATLLVELGPWLSLSGLFAESMLLITPLILLMPNQAATMKFWQEAGFTESQKSVASSFQKSSVKAALAWIYMVLVSFQIASTFSFYKLAVSQQEAMANNPVIQVSKFEEQTGPYTTCLLYLILAWCNVTTVYEYLFSAAFQQDFPRNVYRRMAGLEPVVPQTVAPQTEEQSTSHEIGTDSQRRYQVLQDSETYKNALANKDKFLERSQQLLDNIKTLMPCDHEGLAFKLHLISYQLFLVCIVVYVVALAFKMWQTVGTSPSSIIFLLLSCGLVCFALQFGVFVACGAKGEGVTAIAMDSPVAIASTSAPAASTGAPAASAVGPDERALEKAIVKKFADILEAAFIWAPWKEHRAAVVPCKGKEEDVTKRISEIENFISNTVMERDAASCTRKVQVFVVDSKVHTAISEAALGDLVRNTIITQFFSKYPDPWEKWVVDRSEVSEMAQQILGS